VFIFGLSVGAFAHWQLTQPKSEVDPKIEEKWTKTYNEGKTHERMLQFQTALEGLKTDGTADTLSKQIEAQGQIEDLIVKFREAQVAKYAWLVNALGGAALGAVATLLVSRRGK
jgi:hypothetical protein